MSGERRQRYLMVHLLVALVLLLAAAPFILEVSYGRFIEAALLTLVLVTSLRAISDRPAIMVLAGLLMAAALVGIWWRHFSPSLLAHRFQLIAGGLFVGLVVYRLLRYAVQAPQVNVEMLCAAVSVYLIMGVLWAFAYTLVGLFLPGAFRFAAATDAGRTLAGFEALYFSFATLSTVGYGDIFPVANVARMLAMLEATCGMFYVAILVARLVSIYTANSAGPSKQ
jgi:hypothetical protein